MPAARNYFTYPVSPVVKLYLKNTYYFKKGEQMSGYLSYLQSLICIFFYFVMYCILSVAVL